MNSMFSLHHTEVARAELPLPDTGQWPADLHLHFAATARGTRLVRKKQSGPLYVQRPFYPEGAELAHVYLLHPPGGLVSGDTLRVQMQLASEALVLATTPGAGRVYRAREDQRAQQQCNELRLCAGSSLEWLPQESIVFPGAHARLHTDIELAAGSCFSGWEITVLGLPASNEPWLKGSLLQRLEIRREGRPLLRERLLLDDRTRALVTAKTGLQGASVSGVFVSGPYSSLHFPQWPLAPLLEVRAGADRPALCGITRIGTFLVARYLGSCAQQARQLFILYWQILRPLLLQREACAPAIWMT